VPSLRREGAGIRWETQGTASGDMGSSAGYDRVPSLRKKGAGIRWETQGTASGDMGSSAGHTGCQNHKGWGRATGEHAA